MSTRYNIYEAKTKFSELIEKASEGEEITICKAGKPVAVIGPLPEKPKKPRKGGFWKGKIKLYEPADAPLPDDIIDAFYESDTDYLFNLPKDEK